MDVQDVLHCNWLDEFSLVPTPIPPLLSSIPDPALPAPSAEEKKLQWASMLFCVPCLCIYIGLTWTDRVDQKFAEYNAVHDPPTVIRITRGKYDGCIYPHSHPEFARQQMMFAQQDEHAEEEDDDDDDLVPLVDQQ